MNLVTSGVLLFNPPPLCSGVLPRETNNEADEASIAPATYMSRLSRKSSEYYRRREEPPLLFPVDRMQPNHENGFSVYGDSSLATGFMS